MEYIIKNGQARQVTSRYKAAYDEVAGKVIVIPLKAIYRVIRGRAVLLWQLIRSCFGSGYWVNDRQWSNTDGWNNGT